MTVPLIITNDLEIAYDHDVEGQSVAIKKILFDFENLKIPCTFFSTLDALRMFKKELSDTNPDMLEVGCHGINHSDDENYKLLNRPAVEKNISLFDGFAASEFSRKPICFRGPFMSTSSITHEVLAESGYKADFSVCSQRIDFFYSKGGDIRWLTAPRNTYRASLNNPYRRGSSGIIVVPLSCMLLPFNSGIMYLLGFEFMKSFFDFLMRESVQSGKPIVYQFHSYEFSGFTGTNTSRLPLLQKKYLSSREERYRMNLELIKYMLSYGKNIIPLKGADYINREI
ncbi:MAG TPA: hypothetical protein VN514_05005 [Ignavibacteria bacterium]|nr:hypothetical protein [Ignavibacteria bacterium]